MQSASCSIECHSASVFQDRCDAGRSLLARLQHYAEVRGLLVTGLPRGGIVVAAAVARGLGAELSLVPAAGVAGARDSKAASSVNADPVFQYSMYGLLKGKRSSSTTAAGPSAWQGRWEKRTVLLVDDGAASFEELCAAEGAIRRHGAAAVVLATPVLPGALPTAAAGTQFSDLISLVREDSPDNIGSYYRWFPSVCENEARAVVSEYRRQQQRSARA